VAESFCGKPDGPRSDCRGRMTGALPDGKRNRKNPGVDITI